MDYHSHKIILGLPLTSAKMLYIDLFFNWNPPCILLKLRVEPFYRNDQDLRLTNEVVLAMGYY